MAGFSMWFSTASFESVRRTTSRFVDDELPAGSLQLSRNAGFYDFIEDQRYGELPVDELATLLKQELKSCGVDILRAWHYLHLDFSSHAGIMKSAVKLYAFNKPEGNPLYKQFNEATRAALQRTLSLRFYKYGLFFWLMDDFFDRTSTWRNGRLYRGVNCAFNFSLKKSVFKFNQFVSFSGLKRVALKFLSEGGTLFVIDGVYQVSISRYSPYPEEEEHLIHPDQAFKIVNVQMDKEVAVVYLKVKQ